MRFFIILLSMLYAAEVLANFPKVINVEKEIAKSKCSGKIRDVLQTWQGGSEKWRGVLNEQGQLDYIKPSSMFAVWIKYKVREEVMEFARISPESEMKVRFDKKCVKSVSVSKNEHRLETSPPYIDDDRLFSFIHKNVTGIIYNWSPHMSLSIKGITTIKEVAKELNLPLLILMDPSSEIALAKEKLSKAGEHLEEILINSSMDLSFRQAYIHYPNVLVFKNGRIVNGLLPGLSGRQQYKNFVNQRVK